MSISVQGPGRRPANPPDRRRRARPPRTPDSSADVRKITGAGFVQSLVLGWMADPHAKLEDLAATLGVADQSLDERFNDRAVDCLKRVLNAALGYLFEARPETIPLLRRFTAVAIDDSTSLTLPASLAQEYPGCGGSDPDAGRRRNEGPGPARGHHRATRALRAGAGVRLGPHPARDLAAAAAREPAPRRPGVLRPGADGRRHRRGRPLDQPRPGPVAGPPRRRGRRETCPSGCNGRGPIGSIRSSPSGPRPG